MTASRRGLAAAVALGALVRAPFWLQALRTPADGDLSVIGVMSRAPFASLTMWGQPYGAPLDAWLVRVCTALLGESLLALRLPGFLLGLLLIPLAWGLARRVAAEAALPAALLAALAPPYLLLMAAAPPPFYALALALGGAVLLLALDCGERLEASASPRGRLFALGLLAGLGLWNHLMSASVVAAAGWRLRRHARAALPALLGLALGAAPLAWRLAFDPAAGRPLQASSRDQGVLENALDTLPQMHRPLQALLGAHTPLVADEPAPLVAPPAPVAALLALAWLAALAAAFRFTRGHEAARALALAAAIALVAFPFPLRSGPNTIRFLTPLFLPLVA
ncbi:MAG: glycosyltransferase family 39 protein, partial [Vicinamibacteria bacterium]|nr:glycosyltransferase family 39 protein [Vicinamibacteria bacterium]